MDTTLATYRSMSVAANQRQARRTWALSYITVTGVALLVAGLAVLTAPAPFSLGVLLLLMVIACIVARPVTGLWFVSFFAIAGDGVTAPWYPFAKNLSSKESMLFVSNSVVINPIEICLAAAMLGWVMQMAAARRWTFIRGNLLRPMLAFTTFIFFGLLNGLSHGGDSYAAVWEMRPLFYLVIVYVLATNLFTTAAVFRRFWSLTIAAVAVDAAFGLLYYRGLSSADKVGLEAIGEHSASVHANTYFILITATLTMGAWTLRRSVVLLGLLPIIGVEYILAQRRAAFVSAGIGLILVAIVLFRVNRRAFWRVVPVVVLLFAGYVGAFWNSQSPIGFPAQAVKTVVAPSQVSEKDKSSDAYREAEKYDIIYTIRTQPVTGIGFGKKFLRPIPLADISTFPFFEYITHDALHWIWLKMGIGGFVAMVYLFASAIWSGARRLATMPPGYDAALVLTAVSYVAMYVVYAYVDIAWDAQSLVLMGVAMAFVASETFEGDCAERPRSLGESASAHRANAVTR